MSTETFFQVSQDGDMEKLRTQLEEDASFDLNVKDVHGMTALAYAARNGHVDVVRELLSRGATKTDLLEQGYGLNNPEIASLLGVEEQGQQQHGAEGSGEGYAVMPVDVHGGQQMPDGTISYMNASNFGQGFQMMPPFMNAPYPPQFYPEGMHAPPAVFQPGNGVTRRGNPGHGRKESGANLPPLEVSRMIPCKYFPNCKYGDKCHFAHPQIGLPVSMPPQAHPLSPSMSHPPPMQAMFYQQMPPGYPYMPYGNGPQQFIPMGPPTPLQQHQQQPQQPFGAPQHYVQPTVQTKQGDVLPASHETEVTEIQHEAQASSLDNGDAPQPNGVASEVTQQDQGDATQASSSKNEEGQSSPAAASGSSPTQVADDKDNAASPQAQAQAQSAERENGSITGKPVHRRQSFNSFLHHHAVPFQPQGVGAGADGSMPMMNGHAFAPRNTQGGKARRAAAANGVVANGYPNAKRSSHSGERPPCTFFQAGRCRYGDECRFPHILVDGTDARPIQAQQRQIAAVQMAAVNGAPPRSANAHNAPASAPTGPQADKRAQQQQQQQQQALPQQSPQQKEQPQQQASSSSQPTPAQAQTQERQQSHPKGGKGNQANGVVRSNPSKTTQAATAAAGGKEGGGKKQKNQSQQQGQQQLQRHSQRVPTVNDFPALSSPNPNGGSSSTSPMPTPSAAAAPSGNGASSSAVAAASSPAVPKVNFSAILSAPAPPKQPKAALAEASTEVNGEPAGEKVVADNGAQADDAADGKSDAAAPPAKTHATAAAALAAGIAAVNGSVSPAGKPQQASAQMNGKEKPRAQPNGVAHKEGGKSATSSPVSYKAAAAAPVPTKTTPNGTSAAESAEDDFQLVNRSRSTTKRPSQGGSASGKSGEGYAAQVKAVAA